MIVVMEGIGGYLEFMLGLKYNELEDLFKLAAGMKLLGYFLLMFNDHLF